MSTPAEGITVADRPELGRYEIDVDGEGVGALTYGLAGGMITLRHTEIDPSVGGRGLGIGARALRAR